jgi:hypothetical protein
MSTENKDTDWRGPVADLSRRVGSIERAFFGFPDEQTNVFVPGLMDTTQRTASDVSQIKLWVKAAAVIGVAFVLVAAFPKLAEFVKLAISVAG